MKWLGSIKGDLKGLGENCIGKEWLEEVCSWLRPTQNYSANNNNIQFLRVIVIESSISYMG